MINWRTYLTKANVHHDAVAFVAQVICEVFSQIFLLLSFTKASTSILSDIVTLEQLSNHEFKGIQDMRDLLVQKCFFTVSAEGNFLQIQSPFQILRNKKICGTIGPFDNESSKMHEAEVHGRSMSGKAGDEHARNQVHR